MVTIGLSGSTWSFAVNRGQSGSKGVNWGQQGSIGVDMDILRSTEVVWRWNVVADMSYDERSYSHRTKWPTWWNDFWANWTIWQIDIWQTVIWQKYSYGKTSMTKCHMMKHFKAKRHILNSHQNISIICTLLIFTIQLSKWVFFVGGKISNFPERSSTPKPKTNSHSYSTEP